MFRPKSPIRTTPTTSYEVSILVLVDVSPEVPAMTGHAAIRRMFQSLFSWMFRPKTVVSEHADRPVWFQSLFSWMFRPKIASDRHTEQIDRSVSILVLVDVSPEEYNRALKHSDRHVSILVLVDVSPEDPVTARVTTCTDGFNPCSRGCFARSIQVHPVQHLLHGFNPCSRGCFARRSLITSEIHSVYVSILVLVDVSPEGMIRQSRRPSHILVFQSLFSWMFRPKISIR